MSQGNVASVADNWDKVLFLFLGWLLATLSPVIADAIRKRREIKETRRTLLAELAEVKYRLAMVHYLIESEFGRVDRKLLEWLRPIASQYSGPLPIDSLTKVVEEQLKLDDDQLVALAKAKAKEPGTGLSLKRYPAPFLEARLKTVAWLPLTVQSLMLEIHAQLSILEAELENVQYYFRLTFDSGISGDNRARIEGNLDKGYENYSKTAKRVVIRIGDLENAWKEA